MRFHTKLGHWLLASAVALGLSGFAALGQTGTPPAQNPPGTTKTAKKKPKTRKKKAGKEKKESRMMRGQMASRAEVRRAQLELSGAGLYHGRIDGIAGPRTRAALRTFQADEGLRQTGRIDRQTLASLGLNRRGQASRSSELAGCLGCRHNMAIPIRRAQEALKAEGLYHGRVNGIMNAQTRAALRTYQAQNNLAVNGRLTSQTASSLGVASSSSRGYAARANQSSGCMGCSGMASRSAEAPSSSSRTLSSATVKSAQQALKDRGLYTGQVNGVMNAQTRAAIRKYQAQNNLAANGRLTKETANSLGIVDPNTPGQYFESAGHSITQRYGEAGRSVARGSSQAGQSMSQGEIGTGVVQFGKGVGHAGKEIGVGTAHAAQKAYHGTKKALTPH